MNIERYKNKLKWLEANKASCTNPLFTFARTCTNAHTHSFEKSSLLFIPITSHFDISLYNIGRQAGRERRKKRIEWKKRKKTNGFKLISQWRLGVSISIACALSDSLNRCEAFIGARLNCLSANFGVYARRRNMEIYECFMGGNFNVNFDNLTREITYLYVQMSVQSSILVKCVIYYPRAHF